MRNLLIGISVFFLSGCATLTYPPPPVPEVHALPPAENGLPAQLSNAFSAKHTEKVTGFKLLVDSQEALKWRLALVDEATSTIDLQYFIWQRDGAGVLLFQRLLEAADRGVRVRFLVDDMVFAPSGRSIANICQHPNFDIKLFNPGRVRSTVGSVIEYLSNFEKLNRRMHNKLLVIDNRVAVIGGRNIGNEYFGLGNKFNFRDLDVLAVGQVVPEISMAFDRYWNADLTYPGSAMSADIDQDGVAEIKAWIESFLSKHEQILATYQSLSRNWKSSFDYLQQELVQGSAFFIQDQPVYIGQDEYRIAEMLDHIADATKDEILLVSPYLIPSEGFFQKMKKVIVRGAKVKILDPSMAANNHTAAHSHYKKYRRKLLKYGAELYEFKHNPSTELQRRINVPPAEPKFISLHFKAIVADQARCFIGSLNIDPRAIQLNTENGLYIESSKLCSNLAEQIEEMMSPQNAWRVYLNEDNNLRWESSSGIVSSQPARGVMQRISDFLFRLLPMENQL